MRITAILFAALLAFGCSKAPEAAAVKKAVKKEYPKLVPIPTKRLRKDIAL